MGVVTRFKHRAFVVFDKADAQWAAQLQRRLERTHIAWALIGQDTPIGLVPKDLRSIFRYGGEAPEGAEGKALSDQAMSALDESLFLVVLCSPDAAKSETVNEAVRRFKSLDRVERIIPVIIAGEPNHEEGECFPPALRSKLSKSDTSPAEPEKPGAPPVADARPDADAPPAEAEKPGAPPVADARPEADTPPAEPEKPGAPPVTDARPQGDTPPTEPDEPVAPLVIDARPQGDGKDRAIERLTAALLGVDFDVFLQAQNRLRRGRSRVRNGLVAALLLCAAIVGGLAWVRYELPRNAELLDGTLATGTNWAVRAVEFSRQVGAPVSVSREIAEWSESALAGLADLGADTPLLRYRRADTLLAFSRQEEALGDAGPKRRDISQAATLLADISPEDFGSPELERDLAMAQLTVGHGLLERGATDDALKLLRQSLVVTKRRAAADPSDPARQRDLSLSENAVGDALLAKGMHDEALRQFRESEAVRKGLVGRNPENGQWRRDLSVSQERIGDALLARGELTDALKAYRTSLALRLAAVDPQATGGWQRQASVSYNKIGDVLVAQGEFDDALNSYRSGLALQLGAGERNEAEQRALSVSYERIGDVLKRNASWDEALAAYRTSLGLRQRLAAADPGNSRWQQDLAASHERIGDVLMGQNALDDALAAYRESLATRRRVGGPDPESAAMQRDIALSLNKIGDALTAKGAVDEAIESYRAALAMGERLVALDPDNTQWKWDLLVLQWRLASNGDDPAKRFGLIVETMRELAAKRKLTVEQARWLPAAEKALERLRSQ